jgi:inhibitor of cysteine peptidase
MKKGLLTAVLAGLLLAASAVPATAHGQAVVVLDRQVLDAPAVIDGGAVSLPLRCICRALGYAVTWSDTGGRRTIHVSRNGEEILMDLTDQQIRKNGHLFSAQTVRGDGIRLVDGAVYMDADVFKLVFPVRATYDKADGRVLLSVRVENDIAVVTETLTGEGRYLFADIQYPRLAGNGDAAALEKVNRRLRETAERALAAGEKNADDMAQAIRDGYTGAVGNCETLVDYTVYYNENGLFSVALTEYQYAGGAHGATYKHGFTFDLSTGRALDLPELMAEGSGWRDYLNRAIRREIDSREKAGILSEFDTGRFEDIGQDPDYYLTDGALVIFFQQYDYFPYVAGIQEFYIPYRELAGMMKSEYQL